MKAIISTRTHCPKVLLSMNINSILRVFAYICIWTTPLQVACVFWGIGIIVVTDFTPLSLTNIEFLRNYLAFFLPIIEWLYTWFWNTLLDWIFSLPMILFAFRSMIDKDGKTAVSNCRFIFSEF